MTFSLVARCAETGMFGMAIASSSPAVAARCVYTRAGTGAVASQNVTDPRLGPATLDLMAAGLSASEAVARVIAETEFADFRQVLAVDVQGRVAVHSGPEALGVFADAAGRNVIAAGNLLADKAVPAAMVAGFERAAGHFGDRLLAGLRAGLCAGGEAGPVHSAGVQISDAVSWPVADLRCDWTETCPVTALEQAWRVYKPQISDYVQRALDPRAAPSYGVPGNE
ncbi:DUF1028 domain-containing protein [Roseobacter ponti]|uniref:DUF1028 domain-containing protein n=1 Tax=Roseobacter ponti TaxID=1891787 RepID=A0A858ST81_9RHOB|nr:DUF1028 domain-containing protein [Roseobacter ponti]QJF51914.1 DUF1028 domain-containing protein [Roseobacter ponti]